MAIGDVVRVTLGTNDNLRNFFSTWHYAQDTGSATAVDCIAFANNFITTYTARLIAAGCNTTAFEVVRVQCLIGPSVGNVGEATFPGGTIGTYGAPSDMPPEIAINITRKIPMAGKKFRGRLFWGPVTSGMFSNAESGAVNQADAALNGLTVINSSTFTHVGDTWFPVLVHGTGKPVVYTRTAGYIQSSVVSGRNGSRRKRKDRELD